MHYTAAVQSGPLMPTLLSHKWSLGYWETPLPVLRKLLLDRTRRHDTIPVSVPVVMRQWALGSSDVATVTALVGICEVSRIHGLSSRTLASAAFVELSTIFQFLLLQSNIVVLHLSSREHLDHEISH